MAARAAAPEFVDDFWFGVRRERRCFPVDASPFRQTLQPKAIGAVIEVANKVFAGRADLSLPEWIDTWPTLRKEAALHPDAGGRRLTAKSSD